MFVFHSCVDMFHFYIGESTHSLHPPLDICTPTVSSNLPDTLAWMGRPFPVESCQAGRGFPALRSPGDWFRHACPSGPHLLPGLQVGEREREKDKKNGKIEKNL